MERLICAWILPALVLGLGGCQVAGVVAHVMGPPAIEPQYVPAKMPMLVLAENYANPSAGALQAEQLERFILEELRSHEVAPLAPEYEKVYALRSEHPAEFRRMSIDQLGQLAGAQQVLYVNLQTSTADLGAGAEVVQGRSFALVRIVDATTGETLWPVEGSDGFPVRAESPLVRLNPGTTDAAVRQEVQRALADQIVKLFYKYKPE